MGEARRRRFAVAEVSSDALDRLTGADERFFARTGRHHRLRLAGHAEVVTLAQAYGPQAARCEPGERIFAVVRMPFDGAHLKVFLPNLADSEVDVPEVFASALFERLSSHGPEIGLLERELRRRKREGERG